MRREPFADIGPDSLAPPPYLMVAKAACEAATQACEEGGRRGECAVDAYGRSHPVQNPS